MEKNGDEDDQKRIQSNQIQQKWDEKYAILQ